VVTLPAAEAPEWLAADGNRQRGEFVLVLHARAEPEAVAGLPSESDRTLAVLLNDLPLRQAVTLAASLTGVPRNTLYARALELRGAGRED
jgi:16S rRNA (cytidine1402-2'-O)-methyltransferase